MNVIHDTHEASQFGKFLLTGASVYQILRLREGHCNALPANRQAGHCGRTRPNHPLKLSRGSNTGFMAFPLEPEPSQLTFKE